MSVIRLIYVSFPPEQAAQAERNWKVECAPIMIRQDGCLSEKLLRCRDHPGEYISYSEWDSQESLEKYLASPDHEEVKRHNRNIRDAKVTTKVYDLV